MTDWLPLNPWPPLAGGLLIGTAAVLLYAGLGRIAGISGILFSAIRESDGRRWRVGFITGMVLGAWLAAGLGAAVAVAGEPDTRGVLLLLVAGLLTGIGTRLGGGCTSGHGICGIARLSPRSLVATLCFMVAGMAAATFLRPLLAG